MYFAQPEVLSDPAELARSLVAWLNRSRVPALFREWTEDPVGINRSKLRTLVESWNESGCKVDHWPMREEFEKPRFGKVHLFQEATNKPVKTTIIWGDTPADLSRRN